MARVNLQHLFMIVMVTLWLMPTDVALHAYAAKGLSFEKLRTLAEHGGPRC